MPQTTKRKPVKKRRRKKRRSHYSRTAAIAIGIVLLFLILAFWLLGRYVRQLTSAVSEAVPEGIRFHGARSSPQYAVRPMFRQ